MLDSIIERSSKLATFMNVSFDQSIIEDVIQSFKAEQSMQRTGKVEVIVPTRTLSDLIVEDSTLRDIEDVIFKAKNLNQNNFQFIEKLRKKGRMVALFSGPPGTGKSMAAEVIANQVGKELWSCECITNWIEICIWSSIQHLSG
jgi:SpoVK/Ycf46/Vps4 family AAA+-type ATPase